MLENIIYILLLILFFTISFQILLASKLEQVFKKGKVWQIRTGYLFISLVTGHLLAKMFIRIISFIPGFSSL